MNTNKAAYWIALAAFALGLGSEYQKGSFQPVHRIADSAEFALCRITTHAQRTLALAGVLTGPVIPVDDLSSASTELAEARTELREEGRDRADVFRDQLRAEAEMMRVQARLQRAQIRQIRNLSRSQVRLKSIPDIRLFMAGQDKCPKARITVQSSEEDE